MELSSPARELPGKFDHRTAWSWLLRTDHTKDHAGQLAPRVSAHLAIELNVAGGPTAVKRQRVDSALDDIEANEGWRLRRATLDDVDGLLALASKPLVYRYLFDGVAPSRELIAGRVERSVAGVAEAGFGMWLLEGSLRRYAGCVELRPYPAPRSAELTYLLNPELWGRRLATRMALAAITQAFVSGCIDSVIAGADLPNSASLSLMRRLGMQFQKEVLYPLGAGVEYVLHRGDGSRMPRSALIPLAEDFGSQSV